jgi:5-oxoprolinase (ATP-hydrolysing) subunit C
VIEILSSSALATVQDLGRLGALRWGVGTSGAMDPLALAAGNLLLGNDEGAAAIEIPVFPFEVRFDADCAFTITGADCASRLDDVAVLPWWTCEAKAGQVLRLGVPRQDATWRACRAYLCVAGGIDVPEVLGSRSTQLRGAFGGLDGRALRRGDRLHCGARARVQPAAIGLVPPALGMPLHVDGFSAVRVLPAAEYDCYTDASRVAFWSQPWKITAQSDRYGYRLAGTPLEAIRPVETRSHGIVPGVIQVPASGQPIIQMCDAQPSGGYPKIGTVIEADRWRLGQIPIGNAIRFIQTTWDEAIDALEQNERWIGDARRLVSLSCADVARS